MDSKAALRIASALKTQARKIESDLMALRAHCAALHVERNMLFEVGTGSIDLHGLLVRMQSAGLHRITQDISGTEAAIFDARLRLDLARRRCAAIDERILAASLAEAEAERAGDIAEWVALRVGRANASFPKG